jgi:integrase
MERQRVAPLAPLADRATPMIIDLRVAARGYLAAQRARGHRFADHDWLIRSFLDDLERRGVTTITVVDALTFARGRPETAQRWHAQRLQVIRGLARYVHTLDPAAAELVPAGLIRARATRRHPYLYSNEQIETLLAAASALSPPSLAATMHALIGLLSVSGMRIGEVVALDVADLDTDRQVLRVTGKYGKQRIVPLHPSTVEALARYLGGHRAAGPLFIGGARGPAERQHGPGSLPRARAGVPARGATGVRHPTPARLQARLCRKQPCRRTTQRLGRGRARRGARRLPRSR